MRSTGVESLAVFLASCLWLVGCGSRKGDVQAEAPPPVSVEHEQDVSVVRVDHPEQFPLVAATVHETTSHLIVTGTVNPDISRSVPVISIATGRVVEIDARLGDTVKKGQLLLRVQSADMSAAFSDYRKAVADEQLARTQFERSKLLYDKGAISLKDLEVSQDTEDKAKVDVENTIERLRVLGGNIDHPSAAKPYMSDEHFTVDGTLIVAWASHKSFRPKDGSGKPPGAGGDVDFRGEKRKNQTPESTTDPDARLFTKSSGSQAKLSYMGHVLMENRNGLLVQTLVSEASGRAERDAALLMVEAIPPGKRVTLGGDKNYDTREFVRELRGMNITPHVAQNTTKRRSAVDERTTRHAGYEVSQRKRKRVEQSFGWMKMIGMLRKVKLRGIDKVGWLFAFTGAAYNLCRLGNLMAGT